MKKVNVQNTAATRRVPLVRAYRNAVEKYRRGRVITTDMTPMAPSMYFGHKRPPKKRPANKMKFCKECGIRH